MTKRQRKMISDLVHETHMRGRIYNRSGEHDTPGEVYIELEKLVETVIERYGFKVRINK